MIGLLIGLFAAVVTAAIIMGSLVVYGSRDSHTKRHPATVVVAGDNPSPASTTISSAYSERSWRIYITPVIKWVLVLATLAAVLLVFIQFVLPLVPDTDTVFWTGMALTVWAFLDNLSLAEIIGFAILLIGLIVLVKGFVSYFRGGSGRFPKLVAQSIGALACLYFVAWLGYVSVLGWEEGHTRMTTHTFAATSWMHDVVVEWWTPTRNRTEQKHVVVPTMIHASNSGQIIAPTKHYAWLSYPTNRCYRWWVVEAPNGNLVETLYRERSTGKIVPTLPDAASGQGWTSKVGRPVRIEYESSIRRTDGSCEQF